MGIIVQDLPVEKVILSDNKKGTSHYDPLFRKIYFLFENAGSTNRE
jgi:hypothetical protein